MELTLRCSGANSAPADEIGNVLWRDHIQELYAGRHTQVVQGEKQAAANEPSISPLAAAPATMPKNQIGTAVFTPETIAGPQLLTNEPMNLQQQRDKEQKVLHGYGWVNQGAGIARMPIDEAKKLLLGRGLPVSEGEEVSPTLGTRLPALGESSGGRIITAPPQGAPQEAAPAAPEGGQPAGHQPGAPAHGEQPTAKPQGRGGH